MVVRRSTDEKEAFLLKPLATTFEFKPVYLRKKT